MKPDVEFNHDLHGVDSCGISKERFQEIEKFLKKLVRAATVGQLKRSEVVEEIILFAENTVEAVVMATFIGTQKIQEHKIVVGGGLPKEVRETLEELRAYLQTMASPGMSVDGDGNLN